MNKLNVIKISRYFNKCSPKFLCNTQYLSTVPNPDSEYSDTPEYPEWTDVTSEEKWRKHKLDWHKKIESLPTVEQKLVELNMPKFYGYYSIILKDELLRPASLDFIKFITRTKVIESFPDHYYDIDQSKVDAAVNSMKSDVEELILISNHQINRISAKSEQKKNQRQNEDFVIGLNHIVRKHLKGDIQHLDASSVDIRPRIEGFWWVGGFEAPGVVKKRRESLSWLKHLAEEPMDKAMRSSIQPILALRSCHGLPDVVPLDASSAAFEPVKSIVPEGDVVEGQPLSEQPKEEEEENVFDPYKTDPSCWGFIGRRKRASLVPGFWPGEKDEYGHVFFHARRHVDELKSVFGHYAEDMEPIMLQQKTVLAGFTQALSYAFYQGFTPVNELTYPVVQQLISTDGRKFQFGLYQLNTCCLHSHLSIDNPRRNFLWLSQDMVLYDRVEGEAVKGLNPEVLKSLCSAYLKQGEHRSDSHPYLADYKYLMHHDAPEEYKEEFQKFVFRLTRDGRTGRKSMPEIAPWEKIYNIYFKTRPFDTKHKYYENRWAENPHLRRLDDYMVPYIPKVRRVNFKIRKMPRINSEHLFKHDWKTIKKDNKLFEDDEIAFKTMNIRKDTPPYYNGLKWSRGMIARKTKL